jgi:hypothetical protein
MRLLTREKIADGSYVKVTWEVTGESDDRMFAAHFRIFNMSKGMVLVFTGCYDQHEGSQYTLSREESKMVTNWAVDFVAGDDEW